MLYDDAKVNALIGDLTTYKGAIQAERDNAETAKQSLLKVGWQGDAALAFEQKHNTLMTDMDDLLRILGKGIENVKAALATAQATDQHVADDFVW
ncbi:WXG100 family type VII secretion target [Nocardia xishanensis]|uniref:WXG100 family type VII secretion target n=1 Tax=Nocardia xishanensis TaxID=238964 RepID=A0ABW7XAD6_9NOCA